MRARKSSGRRIKTAANVFDIVGTVRELDGATLTEIADDVGLAPSTVHQYLETMLADEYLVRSDDSYELGLRFLFHGDHVRERLRLDDVIQPALERMVEETNEIAWFVVEEHGEAVFVTNAKGERAVQPFGRLGMRTEIHTIAAGKAILAQLPGDQVSAILDRHGLEAKTEHTITSRDALFEELETIRARGYALNEGENIEGWRAVAAPIVHDGSVVGSIATSGPENRIGGDRFTEALPSTVTGFANEIQLELLSS